MEGPGDLLVAGGADFREDDAEDEALFVPAGDIGGPDGVREAAQDAFERFPGAGGRTEAGALHQTQDEAATGALRTLLFDVKDLQKGLFGQKVQTGEILFGDSCFPTGDREGGC